MMLLCLRRTKEQTTFGRAVHLDATLTTVVRLSKLEAFRYISVLIYDGKVDKFRDGLIVFIEMMPRLSPNELIVICVISLINLIVEINTA